MAYSYVRYTGNGSTTNYTFSFPTISTDHIKVRVNGTLVTNWSFLSASTIQFAAAPANAAIIEIRRETPKDSSIVNFTDGSVLLERDLDLLATYDLYLAQETEDDLEDTIRVDSQGRFDALNKRIINVADPVAAQDAVTKNWLETTYTSELDAISLAAASSATAAAGSATTATTQATNATASAVSAANSAAAAATALDNFDDRYLGQKASDPAVDNDGNALITGALYYNTTDSAMRVYTGTGWINASSAQVATMKTYVYVATAAQTTFTGNDANGSSLTYVAPYLIVSLNGLELRPVVDYTATSGLSVVLTTAATAGDELQVQAFSAFNVANIQSANVSFQQGGTGSTGRSVDAKLKEVVSVKDFGAVGDGVTDDTAAINTAVTYANSVGGGVVTFPFGTYMVNASGTTTGIQLKSGVYLNLTGSKLKALSANSSNYRLVWIQEQSNCGVIGGEIEGDKLTTTATSTDAQGHGIYIILNCANVTVQGVKVWNCYGDGIYTGRLCTGTKILNCVLTNNGRNNISVVSSSNVVIDGCDISNANGNLPEAGIDVEPNPGDAVSNNVVITNCHIYGNTNEGISFPAPAPTPLIETAIVANCHIYNNGTQGIRASYVKNLEVTGCVIYGNGGGGIYDTAALATSLNIDGNLIFGNTGSGVEGFASGTVISNNTIRNNTQWGVRWRFGQHVTIAGNTISDHGEDGISYERAYNCAIVGNTIKNSQKHGIFITGTVTSSVTRSRKVTIEGNTVAFSGLLTDNTYSGIFLDTYANTSVVTGNTVVAGTTGNLPLHAIYAVDASVYVASNQTDGGAKSGNSQVNIGGVSMPSFLNSPNVLSHTYAPRYYLPGLCFITSGTGSPEGALSAAVGSIFLRTNGGAGTTLYVKESGTSTTGWVAK